MRSLGVRGVLVMALLATVCACGREEPRERSPHRLNVDVFADSGRSQRLVVSPPDTSVRPRAGSAATVWLTQVTPSRATASEPALPEAGPTPPDSTLPAPPGLAVDPDLKPPLLRAPGRLVVPPHRQPAVVELDVRVAEDGSTSDALWAGGSNDSALVPAATHCALEMRFYPALREGRPVAGWCRQRFEFPRAR